MKFYTRYSPPPSPSLSFSLPSMTDQSQAKDCDINVIIDRFNKTGYLVDPMHPGSRQPLFGDFTGLSDYQACLDTVIEARNRFNDLPAKIRDRFKNNPAELLAFLNDEKNRDEAVELGLINKPFSDHDEAVSDSSPAKDEKKVQAGE